MSTSASPWGLSSSQASNVNIASKPRSWTHQDYTVGWICALPSELAAALAMLDVEHAPLTQHRRDDNIYTLGSISGHNVVIACLPAGRMGNNPAATVAAQMRYSFSEIQFGLMVGIGGGAPSETHDIRLGDVVVSQPGKYGSGVLQYDFGRTVAEGKFVPTGSLNAPPSTVLHAVAVLQARHSLRGHQLAQHLAAIGNSKVQSRYTYQGVENDLLFEPTFEHNDGAATCDHCDRSRLVHRPPRDSNDPVIHYGTIASGNQVMRHGGTRERLRQEHDVLCFEMEAAGLMDNFPCLVVRGICDYADSHKTKQWQEYAAAAAAAYAKELLAIVPPISVGKQIASSAEQPREFAVGFHLERVHMIPHFTPRVEYMNALTETLLPSSSPKQKLFVLYGMGGIGKTQLAIKFATDHQHDFTSVFFLDGSSKESLLKSFALAFRRIMEAATTGSTSPASENLSLQGKMDAVLQWLLQGGNTDWLLIYDNIDKEPTDDGGFDILPMLPPKDHGSILITTRLAPLSRLGHSKKVGRMSVEETVELLDTCLGNTVSSLQDSMASRPSQDVTRQALLKTLDGLPLAISQAGRFMNTLNLRPETYLKLYTSSRRDVMDMLSRDSALQDTEKGSIRTTWMTSLNSLRERALKDGSSSNSHAAYWLLQLFAYFEPSDLSYDIMRFGLIINDVPEWFRHTFRSKIRFFAVVKVLLDLCLIDNNAQEGCYSMHRVVHDWLCTYVSNSDSPDLIRLAVGAISYSAPLVLTHHWEVEQQQLSVHAVHVLPSLVKIPPDYFLVDYYAMSTSHLHLVASLLGEPVVCWKLMRFELTLTGISRLLSTCGRSNEAERLIRWFQARYRKPSPGADPIDSLLMYAELSGRKYRGFDVLDMDAFYQLAKDFTSLGSPSWAIKTQNLLALDLEATGKARDALSVWQTTLEQSRQQTGSVFTHPTWMVFSNLDYRLNHDLQAKLALSQKYEQEARLESTKIWQAQELLFDLQRMKSIA